MTGFVGVDLGGTQLRVAVADRSGHLLPTRRLATEADKGPDHVIARITSTVAAALRDAGLRPREVRALGIGLPGPLDPQTGVVYSPANLPGWKAVPLNRILTRETAIPSYLYHDAHLAALAEARRGAARGARDVAYVTVSTGIGAGFILEGGLYGGAHGSAGEVGHIVLQRDGPLCNCGNHGCLEALASGTAIAREARAALRGGARSVLRRITDHQIDARDVHVAARAGDRLARAILEEAGAWLGIGMGTLVDLFNPEVLVLGGSVMKSGQLITRPMRERLVSSSLAPARRGLRIVRPALGQDAGLIGAIEWARLCASR